MKHIFPVLTATSTLLVACSANAANLTAYYDFEGTGADRFDDPAGAYADNLDGQYNAAFSSDTAGAFAGTQSASFDGNSALFTETYTTDLSPSPNAYTIMFWVKAEDILQENTSTRLMTTRVGTDGSTDSNNNWQVEGFGYPEIGSLGDRMNIRQRHKSTGEHFNTANATNAIARADQNETEAVWRHVAFVIANSGSPIDGGAYSMTFVDGSQVGSTINPDPAFDGADLSNDVGQWLVGRVPA